MSNLTTAENAIAANKHTSPLVHHLEIGGLTTAAGGAVGGALGGTFGLVAEGAVQAFTAPLASFYDFAGQYKTANNLLRMESNYMSGASHYGARGVAIGLVVGAAAYAAYEVKNYFDK
ncbi:MAG TPA: hypothetical protein V6C89_19650 [Drouetiella sp.]|jgi:hypothetical protein